MVLLLLDGREIVREPLVEALALLMGALDAEASGRGAKELEFRPLLRRGNDGVKVICPAFAYSSF